MKLMELVADLDLNASKFNSGISAAGTKGNSFAKSLTSSLGNAVTVVGNTIGNVATAIADVAVKATAAAASLSAALVAGALTAYSETEQLYGGVETMFGEHADIVKKYAAEAFMTAGMSANDYMSAVVGFSASLLQGLGGDTEAAANYADMAIKDMSDNANKFGTDMALILNAYQGFAKGNYTMLDNLKLGYGGTAEEMARLINDSGVLGETIVTAATVSEVPLYKIFEAIHVIQEEMGVTGTTAEEATETIAGSFNAFKAAWENLLSGFADDDKEMSKLVDDLVATGQTLVENVAALLPIVGEHAIKAFDALLSNWDIYSDIKTAFEEKGIAGAFAELTAYATNLFAEWAPMAYNAGTDLLAGIYSGITGDATTGEEIRALLGGIWADVSTKVTDFTTFAGGVLGDIYTGLTGEEATAENIKATLGGIWDSASDKMSDFLTAAKDFATTFAANFDATAVGELVGGVTSVFTSAKEAAGTLFGEIYTSLTGQEATAENIGATVSSVFNRGLTAANEVLTAASTFFTDISTKLGDPDATLLQKVGGVFQSGYDMINGLLSECGSLFSDMYVAITGDTDGAKKLQSFIDDPLGTIANLAGGLTEAVSEAVGEDFAAESTWQHVYEYSREMMKNPSMYGFTEDELIGYQDIVKYQDPSRTGYEEAANAIVEAWMKVHPGTDVVTENERLANAASAIGGTMEAGSAERIEKAVNAFINKTLDAQSDIAFALRDGLAGVTISIDGISIANLVSTNMSRTTRSKRHTGVGSYLAGR